MIKELVIILMDRINILLVIFVMYVLHLNELCGYICELRVRSYFLLLLHEVGLPLRIASEMKNSKLERQKWKTPETRRTNALKLSSCFFFFFFIE